MKDSIVVHLNFKSGSMFPFDCNFVTNAENPHSQRYDVAKGKSIFCFLRHFWVLQNFIKLTFRCKIFKVLSLVSSMNSFNFDGSKFNESMCVRNWLEYTKNSERSNHQKRSWIDPAVIEYGQKSNLSTIVYWFQNFLVSRWIRTIYQTWIVPLK